MYHLSLPPLTDRRVSFYLATEEYVAREKRDVQELFFTWQVKPSVIFGRHQDIHREVNLDYCRKNGVETFRRKSGGGCVYADMGNLMLAYIATGDNIQFIHMLPGYTHNIINLSDTENLVTVMYCNEIFDPNRPDTYFEKV